jgi:hypothetical protein
MGDGTTSGIPVRKDIVETVSAEFDIDTATLCDALAAANQLHCDVICEVRALHDVVDETGDWLLAFDENGREWVVVADEICDRVGAPDRRTLSSALRACHNRQVESVDFSESRGEGASRGRVDGSDAIIVAK